MEIDSLFSSPRWKILELLARRPSSPLEISKILLTSVAYISQQLKLLEAAGIVSKERTRAVEKGKARNLYYLPNELVHLTALLRNNPIRRTLKLSDHQKTILKIWILADERFSYLLEKLFWVIEEDLTEIQTILVDSAGPKLNVVIVSDSKKVKQKLENFTKRESSLMRIEIINSYTTEKSLYQKFIPIYDPQLQFNGNEKMKGGFDRNETKL